MRAQAGSKSQTRMQTLKPARLARNLKKVGGKGGKSGKQASKKEGPSNPQLPLVVQALDPLPYHTPSGASAAEAQSLATAERGSKEDSGRLHVYEHGGDTLTVAKARVAPRGHAASTLDAGVSQRGQMLPAARQAPCALHSLGAAPPRPAP